jgi:hypothetical protein
VVVAETTLVRKAVHHTAVLPPDMAHHNSADSSRVADRFDNDCALALESDNHYEACHWSFPGAEEHSDIQSWENGVACMEIRAGEMMSCKKSRDSRRYPPMLQDHGFESRSR